MLRKTLVGSLHRFVTVMSTVTDIGVIQATATELPVSLQDDTESLSNQLILASEALAAT